MINSWLQFKFQFDRISFPQQLVLQASSIKAVFKHWTIALQRWETMSSGNNSIKKSQIKSWLLWDALVLKRKDKYILHIEKIKTKQHICVMKFKESYFIKYSKKWKDTFKIIKMVMGKMAQVLCVCNSSREKTEIDKPWFFLAIHTRQWATVQ